MKAILVIAVLFGVCFLLLRSGKLPYVLVKRVEYQETMADYEKVKRALAEAQSRKAQRPRFFDDPEYRTPFEKIPDAAQP